MKLLWPMLAVAALWPSTARADDAGAGDAGTSATESTYGCVESIPKGAKRPVTREGFPGRGTSGYAAVLRVTLVHGKGERVLPAGLDLTSAAEAKKVLRQAGFVVPDQAGVAAADVRSEPDKGGDTVTTHFELPLVLLPTTPGRNTMTLPSLPVAVARANGEIMTVCTDRHAILVEDPIANTPEAMPQGNPAPRPQREEWTSLKRAVLYSALGIVVGGVLAYVLYRILSRPKAPVPPPPPRPPWEIALERLDEVRHAGLLESHRVAEYYDRVSDAVRSYLGARFGFDGLESTTDEILAALTRQGAGFVRLDVPSAGEAVTHGVPAPGVAFTDVAAFLRDCDLVKFANLTPTVEQCNVALAAGEHIVRSTMPFRQASAQTEAMLTAAADELGLERRASSKPPKGDAP